MTPSSARGPATHWRRLAASVRDLPAALRLQLTPASAALMVLLLVGPGTLMIFVPTWQAVAAMVALVAVLPPLILTLAMGYRPATPAQAQAIRSGAALWHQTRADMAPGEVVILDPARCRPMSRLWRRDRVAWPVQAVYLTTTPIDPIVALANGIHDAKTLLTVDPCLLEPDTIYVRHSGEIAVIGRVIARAVDRDAARSRRHDSG